MEIKVPEALDAILKENQSLHGSIQKACSSFGEILNENRLYFFEEYTNHGKNHIESVLLSAEEIITEHTKQNVITDKDVCVLIFAILLHDIAMHIQVDAFSRLILEETIFIEEYDTISWKRLWKDYLEEAKRFGGRQNLEIFGNRNYHFKIPNLADVGELTENDKKLIGEFIRRHHPRIAHEIALRGFIDKNGELIDFASDLPEYIKKLAGIIARSHGTNIRSTYKYLETISVGEWSKPYKINVIYLMAVLRIADYMQFTRDRVNLTVKFKTFSSPISELEHEKHFAIEFAQESTKDPETLYVEARPKTSLIFTKLSNLIEAIQYELDLSWGCIGEIYGKELPSKQPMLKYRRISSNLDDVHKFKSTVQYVPDDIRFRTDTELPKLLVAPLYGNDPTFGVRELLQNAVDACRAREKDDKNVHSVVKIFLSKTESDCEFKIVDNGKGMSIVEIKEYFLNVGSSLRSSLDWQLENVDDNGIVSVQRNGKFGIGVLAAFLLGDNIHVATRRFDSSTGVSFFATRSDEHIELNNDKNLQIGTTITIKISKDIYRLLSRKEVFRNENLYWTNWYVLNKPKVEYYINNSLVPREGVFLYDYNDQISDDWHTLEIDDLKIHWTYATVYNRKYSGINRFFCCNGIVIPNGMKTLSTNAIIGKFPTISVFDLKGILPLRLDRNSFDEKLSFEMDLKREIYKDFIAKLLLHQIDADINYKNINKSNNTYVHSCYDSVSFNKSIVRSKNGFTIDYPFLTNQIFKSIIYIFGGHQGNMKFDIPSNDDIGYVFSYSKFTNSNVDLFFDKGFMRLRSGIDFRHGALKISKHEKSSKKVRDYWVGDSSLILPPTVASTFQHNEAIVMRELGGDNGFMIRLKGKADINLFQDLLQFYFKGEYLIPYSIERRKELYNEAFIDLEPYMRKYLKNPT